MIGGLDGALRSLVRDVVREELKLAVGELARGTSAANDNAGGGYLSIGRAAKIADVAPNTVRTWIRRGKLAGHKAGRVYRVRRCDLDGFLASGSPATTPPADLRSRARDLLRSVA